MEIAFDHIHRGLAEARAGRANYAAAELSMALFKGRVDRLVPSGTIRQSNDFEEDAEGGKVFEFPDIRETVEEAYHDLISGRIPEAIALLDSVVYPDGKPAHEQVIEWFRYLKCSEPVPEGWEVADDLSGTHHGAHAVLIRKVA